MLSFRAGEMIQQMRVLLYEPDNLSSKVAAENAHTHTHLPFHTCAQNLFTCFVCLFMAQKDDLVGKGFAIKSDHLSSVPRTYGVE